MSGVGKDVSMFVENNRAHFKRLNSTTRFLKSYSRFLVYSKADYLMNYLRKFEKELGFEL